MLGIGVAREGPLPSMARHYMDRCCGWTKNRHTLQRLAAQGLQALIHNLCQPQGTACVDSSRNDSVVPSHARHWVAWESPLPSMARHYRGSLLRLDKKSPHSAKAGGTRPARPYPQLVSAAGHSLCGWLQERFRSAEPCSALGSLGKAPCRAWLGTTGDRCCGWTKNRHTLQRLAAQGLHALIHNLCQQQGTACVDSCRNDSVVPSHARHWDCVRSRWKASAEHGSALLELPYWRRTACTTCRRRKRRMTSARWLRSRTWMLKHSTAALKSRSR